MRTPPSLSTAPLFSVAFRFSPPVIFPSSYTPHNTTYVHVINGSSKQQPPAAASMLINSDSSVQGL